VVLDAFRVTRLGFAAVDDVRLRRVGELVVAATQQPADTEQWLVLATAVSGRLLVHPPWRLLTALPSVT
jgi:hypothetical protein